MKQEEITEHVGPCGETCGLYPESARFEFGRNTDCSNCGFMLFTSVKYGQEYHGTRTRE
jgi:hypothetical protein